MPENKKNSPSTEPARSNAAAAVCAFAVLAAFAAGGLNLLKLESRPIPQRRFEYMFFADYEGNLLDEHVKEITSSVIDGSVEFKFIGNYRSKV